MYNKELLINTMPLRIQATKHSQRCIREQLYFAMCMHESVCE